MASNSSPLPQQGGAKKRGKVSNEAGSTKPTSSHPIRQGTLRSSPAQREGRRPLRTVRHGDAQDEGCADPLHVSTDVYQEEIAGFGILETRFHFTNDPDTMVNQKQLMNWLLSPQDDLSRNDQQSTAEESRPRETAVVPPANSPASGLVKLLGDQVIALMDENAALRQQNHALLTEVRTLKEQVGREDRCLPDLDQDGEKS